MPAETEKQQKAAGAALAVKRGEAPESGLYGASKQMLHSMTEEELRHMAKSTKSSPPATEADLSRGYKDLGRF